MNVLYLMTLCTAHWLNHCFYNTYSCKQAQFHDSFAAKMSVKCASKIIGASERCNLAYVFSFRLITNTSMWEFKYCFFAETRLFYHLEIQFKYQLNLHVYLVELWLFVNTLNAVFELAESSSSILNRHSVNSNTLMFNSNRYWSLRIKLAYIYKALSPHAKLMYYRWHTTVVDFSPCDEYLQYWVGPLWLLVWSW